MLDIETFENGGNVLDTDLWKAQNLLMTNKAYLYYLPEFGVTMDMFFSQEYNIQFESFKAYITDTMVQNGINIVKMATMLDRFLNTLILTIGGNKYGI